MNHSVQTHFSGWKLLARLTLAFVLLFTQSASLLAARPVFAQSGPLTHEQIDALEPRSEAELDPAAEDFREVVDTEINSGHPGSNYAFENYLTTGREDGGTQRFLLEPSLYKLPTNITVTSARLYLGVCYTFEIPDATRTITVRRVTSPWHQSLATWNRKPAVGEVVGSTTYTIQEIATHGNWISIPVTSLVQAWLRGDYPNYGVQVSGYEGYSQAFIKFCSNDTMDGPYLAITYETTRPTLAASPATLGFGSDPYHPTPRPLSLKLNNTGSIPLNWQASHSLSWLQLNPTSGQIAPGGSQVITATVSISGLSQGVHSGQIHLSTTTPNALGFPKDVPVYLNYTNDVLALKLPQVTRQTSTAPPASNTAVLIIGVASYLYLPKEYGSIPGIRTASPEDTLYFAGQDGTKIHKTLRVFGLHKNRGAASLAPSALPAAVDNMLLLTDSQATYANIAEAFAWLDDHEDANTNVLIFYSGHGGPTWDYSGDEADNYDEFITPYDADVDPITGDFVNVVTDDLLDAWLDELESEHIAVLLDSCFSGGMAGGSTPGSLADLRSRGLPLPGAALAQLPEPVSSGMAADILEPGREIVTASTADQSSFETGQLQQGVFSYYLIMAMLAPTTDTNGDQVVSVLEAFNYLRPKVIDYVQGISSYAQTPQRFSLDGSTVGLSWSTAGW